MGDTKLVTSSLPFPHPKKKKDPGHRFKRENGLRVVFSRIVFTQQDLNKFSTKRPIHHSVNEDIDCTAGSSKVSACQVDLARDFPDPYEPNTFDHHHRTPTKAKTQCHSEQQFRELDVL